MRTVAAIAAAKSVGAVTRRLGLGGGTALPGLVAERIDPRIVRRLSRHLGRGNIIVTGTNGKTTTSRLLRNIFQAAGLRPVGNRAGSNLMRGVAAALVDAASFDGRFHARKSGIGVFEVDEATLPAAAAALRPRAIVLTNLFRDQLDRYGEVERVSEIWRNTVCALPETAILILNADDPSIASVARAARGPVLFYGLEDESHRLEAAEHASDARWCSLCGAELTYSTVFYGHIGHWRCEVCGNARPSPAVSCTRVEGVGNGLHLDIDLDGHPLSLALPLTGLYNACNATAAVATACALEIESEAIARGLSTFTAAFGRQELLRIDGREVHILLGKNPAGLNQILRTIVSGGSPSDIVFFLNDNTADGRDISWVWDVDFELLSGKTGNVTVSGIRAWDMALRLKYAGIDAFPHVEESPEQALRYALKGPTLGRPLYVVPTYTAMLQVRDLLARWGGRRAFWDEQ